MWSEPWRRAPFSFGPNKDHFSSCRPISVSCCFEHSYCPIKPVSTTCVVPLTWVWFPTNAADVLFYGRRLALFLSNQLGLPPWSHPQYSYLHWWFSSRFLASQAGGLGFDSRPCRAACSVTSEVQTSYPEDFNFVASEIKLLQVC